MNARRAILGSWPVVAPSLPDRDPCSRAGQEYASRHERRWQGSPTIVCTRVVYRNGRDQELSVLASGAEMLAVRAIEGGDRDETRRNGCYAPRLGFPHLEVGPGRWRRIGPVRTTSTTQRTP